MERVKVKHTSLFMWATVAALLSQNIVIPVISTSRFEDEKSFFNNDPRTRGTSPPIPPTGSYPSPPSGSGGTPPANCGNPPSGGHHNPTPAPPSGGHHNPTPAPPSGGHHNPNPAPPSGGHHNPMPAPPSGGHHNPTPAPPSGGGGGGYHSPPSTPCSCTPSTPKTPSTPTPPPPTGGYHHAPPSTPSTPTTPVTPTPDPGRGGGSNYPPYTPTPSTPATPSTPSTPPTPTIVSPPSTPTIPGITVPSPPFDPNSPFTGTCNFWRTHPGFIWGLFGWWGTVGGAFGVTSIPGFGANMSLLQALSNTRTDGLGELYREGTASLLNSMVNTKFPYTTTQVRDSFVSALSSNKAATAQAKLFKQANEGHVVPRT